MKNEANLTVAVFEGDGIGPEITDPTCDLVTRAIEPYAGINLNLSACSAGAAFYQKTGESIAESTMQTAREADAILLAAMGLPDVRYPDGTEISPQIELRMELELYAGVRPVRYMPGLGSPLKDPLAETMDFVLVRESTEGMFSPKGEPELIGDEEARDTSVITRRISEKLFDFSFDLARRRQSENRGSGHVTCVDKANVFQSFAFFRKIFAERAAQNTDLTVDAAYVDAIALKMVQRPWDFDVLVTENLFGDILSDLGAGLIGGLGVAPSADIGDDHAVFQPCHGSAPDIAGRGAANPVAMFLSAAMMLDWLGTKKALPDLTRAGARIETAVRTVFAESDIRSADLGGTATTQEMTDAVFAALAMQSS